MVSIHYQIRLFFYTKLEAINYFLHIVTLSLSSSDIAIGETKNLLDGMFCNIPRRRVYFIHDMSIYLFLGRFSSEVWLCPENPEWFIVVCKMTLSSVLSTVQRIYFNVSTCVRTMLFRLKVNSWICFAIMQSEHLTVFKADKTLVSIGFKGITKYFDEVSSTLGA